MRVASLTNRIFLACTLLATLSLGFAFYFVNATATTETEAALERELTDAALLVMHHLAAAVTSSAIRLLALDPIAVLALQARALAMIDGLASDAETWSASTPADLPALGGALTEILAQDHASWDARLFVA
jgi:urease accessory protein